MMKTLDNNLLKEITRRLVAEFRPEQVILFGSHAWGAPTEDSDIIPLSFPCSLKLFTRQHNKK